MKPIKATLLKQSIINLAVVALLSLLTACATTASPDATTQTGSAAPTAARDYIRNDLGTQNYLGAYHGTGL